MVLLGGQCLGHSISHCSCVSSFLDQQTAMTVEEVQEGRLHGKSQICVTSTKIPLAKASLQLVLTERDGNFVGAGRGDCKATLERVE